MGKFQNKPRGRTLTLTEFWCGSNLMSDLCKLKVNEQFLRGLGTCAGNYSETGTRSGLDQSYLAPSPGIFLSNFQGGTFEILDLF